MTACFGGILLLLGGKVIYSVKRFALHLIARDVMGIKKQDESIEKNGGRPTDGEIPDSARLGYLLDFYGQLLTDRQREIADLYWSDDLSLGEIAEITGLSRQGVRASLEKTRTILGTYEEKLGLAQRFSRAQELTEQLQRELTLPRPDTEKLRELCGMLGELYK